MAHDLVSVAGPPNSASMVLSRLSKIPLAPARTIEELSDIDRFANKSIKHTLVIVFLCYSKCTQSEGLVDLSGTSTHTQGASTVTQGASTVTQSDCRDSQLMRAE